VQLTAFDGSASVIKSHTCTPACLCYWYKCANVRKTESVKTDRAVSYSSRRPVASAPTDSDASVEIVKEVAAQIPDRSARGISTAIGRMIRTGALPVGSRLPTVRELAAALGTSPTTVSEAWNALARTGTIDPRGRNGTYVRDTRRPRGSHRYRSVTMRPSLYVLDLSTGVPDPELLPDPRRALERVSRRNITTSYLDQPVVPALEDHLRSLWPFDPEAMTVVDGAMDAIDRLLGAIVKLGDAVIVEDPGFPPIFDLLEELGATPIGVRLDQDGITEESLREALRSKPVAIVLQPRAHNPTGVSMTGERAAALAKILEPTEVIVIEDDHSGDIAWEALASIGVHLPHRCVHIRSFSKSHGPDLRLAAVGGAGALIDQLVERRLLGPGWSSRLIQAVLLEMLRDSQTVETVRAARQTYRDRRQTMVELLSQHDVHTAGTDGINLWVNVEDEKDALLTLATLGIGAAPGTPFVVEPTLGDHIRVTVGLVSDDPDAVAAAITSAVTGYQRSFSR
jgi:DNA-binding transcriptional MocR family regulator